MSRVLRAILAKDVKLILRNRQVWLPMLVVPLVMSMLIPGLFVYALRHSAHTMKDTRHLLWLLPSDLGALTDVQKTFYLGLNYMFPPFFLMIPLIAGSVIGAGSLVAEKEQRTLETLLYAPVSLVEMLAGKLLASFVPAYAVTLVSFAAFLATVHMGAPPSAQAVGFPYARWLVLLLTLCPAVVLLSLTTMVIVSAYASSFQGAQQLSSFVIVPITFVLIGSSSGMAGLEIRHMLAISAVLVALDVLLLRFVAGRLTYERLLQT